MYVYGQNIPLDTVPSETLLNEEDVTANSKLAKIDSYIFTYGPDIPTESIH